MSFFHAIQGQLVKLPYWRKHQRRLSRRIKALAGTPDAYGDIFAIAKQNKPAAILDIGCYIGDTIERFTDELDTNIYGFEPTPETFLKLQNRFADSHQVQVFNCALAAFEGRQTFFSNANPQTNSLLDNDRGNTRSFEQFTKHVESLEIDVTTLDGWCAQYLPQGDLIVKADVQGGEGKLLEGGHEVFLHQVMAFYSEVQLSPMYKDQATFDELNTRLSNEYGFCIYNIYPCLRDKIGRAIQADVLWVKEEVLLRDSA
ncbi:MAG: FkbM family methyltransferase [Kiritimatiellia bacterium]